MNSSIKLLLGLMAAVPVAHASALILGDTSGNSRGTDAVDIQTGRGVASQVASGNYSTAVGRYNTASGQSATAVGQINTASGQSAMASGQENIASGQASSAVGYLNEASSLSAVAIGVGNEAYAPFENGDMAIAVGNSNTVGGFAAAFGLGNEVVNTDDGQSETSLACGGFNTLDCLNGFAFGEANDVTGDHSMAVGFSITNATASSVMIGPSNTAKVTILSTGYVGIGLGASSPSQMLEVGGNIKTSGSVTAASDVEVTTSSNGLILKSPNGTRFRITISNSGVLSAASL